MRRWLLDILAALSVLLMLGVATLWVISYRRCYMVLHSSYDVDHGIEWFGAVDRGIVCFGRTRMAGKQGIFELVSPPGLGVATQPNGYPPLDARGLYGFYCWSWHHERQLQAPVDQEAVSLPSWSLLPPLMIAPLLWLRRWRRERWTRRGRGFDVVGTDVHQ